MSLIDLFHAFGLLAGFVSDSFDPSGATLVIEAGETRTLWSLSILRLEQIVFAPGVKGEKHAIIGH